MGSKELELNKEFGSLTEHTKSIIPVDGDPKMNSPMWNHQTRMRTAHVEITDLRSKCTIPRGKLTHAQGGSRESGGQNASVVEKMLNRKTLNKYLKEEAQGQTNQGKSVREGNTAVNSTEAAENIVRSIRRPTPRAENSPLG